MQNKTSPLQLLYQDYLQNTQGGKVTSWRRFLVLAFLGFKQIYSFLFWFRLSKCKNPFIAWPARLLHKLFSKILNIAISYHTEIGGGLHLGDGMCMVVNPKTKIGRNCHLSQFLNIGTNHDTPATIGDNVYIGPHVCIVEGVHIGDNATIGAGAVVTRDIPKNATVAGVPARVLNYENPARYIWNPETKGRND